jgi:protein-L-isoaspartate(D-aspartate) O-methyltransferase
MVTRHEMIERQLKGRDIYDPVVINAMSKVDRTQFVPPEFKAQAYRDGPLPIGKDQTISQPYIVAYMAQALNLKPEDTVLEIGTGCGYNAAVLSRIVSHVYSIEIIEWLAEMARENLEKTNFKNISVRHGDGFLGWPEKAPFDAIMLTAAPSEVPEPLKEQLKVGGRLLAPVGDIIQSLVLLYKTEVDNYEEKTLHPVRFVPMTGLAQKQ